MRRRGLKRSLLLVIAILAALSATACVKRTGRSENESKQTGKKTPQSVESVFEGKTIQKVTIYDRYSPVNTVKTPAIIPEDSLTLVWGTEDSEEIARLVVPFDGWNAEEHKGISLERTGRWYICFDDQVLVEYGGGIDDHIYSGRIYSDDGFRGSYDLPSAFCEAIEEILKQNASQTEVPGFEGKSIRRVTIYDVSGEGATYKVEGHVFVPGENLTPLWETEELEQVEKFVTAFDEWKANEHMGMSLDRGGQCFICFDDQVLIEYCGRIDDAGYVYFGRIYTEDGCQGNYDLPVDFCEAVEEILHA